MSSLNQSDTYSVSSLFAELKDMMQENYPEEVRVSGELSEFTAAGSGHWYFSLKDEEAQLICVMFKSVNVAVSSSPEKGAILTLIGRLSFYEKRGGFQLVVNQMIVGEQGELQRRYEELKKKLYEEGLFAQERKKSLPRFIMRLGLITSESGAAVHDVLKVLARRMPMMRLTFFPVPVQGDKAAPQILAALAEANRHKELDAVLITRGGGSIEDLWCFNDERLVRAIAASSLPVVTAIGHEIDYTLADFAADKRAATPSAAAEQLSIDSPGLAGGLDEQAARMKRAVDERMQDNMQECDFLQDRLKRSNPLVICERRLQELSYRLKEFIRYYQSDMREKLAGLQERLFAVAPHKQQQQRAVQLKEVSLRLHHIMESLIKSHQEKLMGYDRVLQIKQRNYISTATQQLERWEGVIKALSPQSVLERGYALVSDKRGGLVRDVNRLKVKEQLRVRLARGSMDTEVKRIYDDRQRGLNFSED